ncbi:hypothetical protein HDU96_003839, partial [Phlyctochytrium bullatum]
MPSSASASSSKAPVPATTPASEKKANASKATWTADQESYLLDLCLAAPDKGTDKNFKKDVWTQLVKDLNKHFGTRYTLAQVKTKLNALKSDHTIFAKMRDISGWGWDEESMMITADDHQWDTYLA